MREDQALGAGFSRGLLFRLRGLSYMSGLPQKRADSPLGADE